MFPKKRIYRLIWGFAASFLLSQWLPTTASASTLTYTFTNDTAGQTPVNTTIANGTFQVANQSILGNSLKATALGSGTSVGITFNNFASSTDQTLIWKEAYDSSGGRSGFTLRAQLATTTAISGTDIKQGYLFQINHAGASSVPNTVRIYRIIAGTATVLTSASLTSATPRWFKATVIGTALTLYYSDDGTNYTSIASATDSTYTSGIVQYASGFGSGVGLDYVDDITYTTGAASDVTAPVISAVASTTDSSSATITWTTDELSDSQVNYGATATYTATTTITAAFSTSHTATISGLDPSTTYHFRVRSTDASLNLAASSDYTFTTTAVANSIRFTSPVSYQVAQRNSSNLGSISISGTYTGTPTAIEASWNGGTYATINSSPSGNTFSGTLSNQTAGQGTLTVRFTNDTTTSTSTSYVGIGDIFVIAGQSNASGRGFTNQVYTNSTLRASLFGNDDTWKELADPTDSSSNQVDSVSTDSSAAGSVWPLIATLYLADQNVPVAFIPTALGGTTINQWQRNTSASTLYGSMYRRINAIGSVKAVLFMQGETNASNGITQAAYLSALENFTNAVYSDFGVMTVVGQIGNNAYPASQTDAVRLAQIQSWDIGTTSLPGPTAPDISLLDESGDNLHFKSNGDLQTWGNRWWAAIQKDFYSGSDGRGPQFVSAEENSDRTAVTLIFSDDTLPVIPSSGFSGFVVKDGGTTVGVMSTTTVSTNAVRIGLASALSSSATVSFGSGASASSTAVLTDSSTYNLPLEVFIDQSVSTGAAPTVTNNGSSSGTLAVGTTQATLAVTTSENAQCKYSTSQNTAFSSMTNTFTTTGIETPTTSHSTTVSGLSDNSSYTYYVRCQDAAGNANSSDLVLSFTVAGTRTTTSSGGGSPPPVPQAPSGGYIATASASTVLGQTLLTFQYGSDITKIAISDNSTYNPASYIPATSSILWAIPKKGKLFVRYCNVYGKCSDSIHLLTGLTLGDTSSSVKTVNAYSRNLTFKDAGPDVQALQQFLISQGYIIPAGVTSYFGLQTQAALVAYQKANNITPSGGYFGPITRAIVAGGSNSISPTISQLLETLKFNDIDEKVRQLQMYLNKQGFIVAQTGPGSPGHETNYFGPATDAAAKRFKQASTTDVSVPTQPN